MPTIFASTSTLPLVTAMFFFDSLPNNASVAPTMRLKPITTDKIEVNKIFFFISFS